MTHCLYKLTLKNGKFGQHKVKCGTMNTLNNYAKKRNLKFVRQPGSLFGGYYNDKDGNSYLVDIPKGYAESTY